MTAPRRAEPVTQLVLVVLRCHWVVTMAATVPMTNRSYASVKKPMPEMSTARRWNLLLGASLRRSLTVTTVRLLLHALSLAKQHVRLSIRRNSGSALRKIHV